MMEMWGKAARRLAGVVVSRTAPPERVTLTTLASSPPALPLTRISPGRMPLV